MASKLEEYKVSNVVGVSIEGKVVSEGDGNLLFPFARCLKRAVPGKLAVEEQNEGTSEINSRWFSKKILIAHLEMAILHHTTNLSSV